MSAHTIHIGQAAAPIILDVRSATRHGLIAGATGTGKTVSLQTLAEGFSRVGVPVFVADVKGDLAGLGAAGANDGPLAIRAQELGVTLAPRACPVALWDVHGAQGHPLRTTVSEIGPVLLARMLDLNPTQEGVLSIAFEVADDDGLLLLDLKDLRAVLTLVGEQAASLSTQYGNVSKASIGAIQRQLLVLEQQGGARFLGEPALALADLLRCDAQGQGIVNILAADALMSTPRLYATFLLWLLSELFEELPEVGDVNKPRLVFFFDEAHLLFDGAPKSLLEKVTQVVRLIRSKGVSVFFITQNPLDVPEDVLGQLGNRIQHALRAFTPRDQRAVKAAAETFRPNPAFATVEAITTLGKGEALVSFLDASGVPTPVERCRIRPPSSRVGPLTPDERRALIAGDPMDRKYREPIDAESAHEVLQQRVTAQAAAPERAEEGTDVFGRRRGGRRLTTGQAVAREVTRTVANRVAGQIAADVGKAVFGKTGATVGRALVRGILGGLLRR